MSDDEATPAKFESVEASGHVEATDGHVVFSGDVSLNVDTTAGDSLRVSGDLPEQGEYEGSLEVEVGLEQTVVCHHCGEVNGVPDALFLELFDEDPSCSQCSFPLGVRR